MSSENVRKSKGIEEYADLQTKNWKLITSWKDIR